MTRSVSLSAPRVFFLTVVLVLFAVAFEPFRALADPSVETLTFVTKTGEHAFDVEIADTEASRMRGLMRRKTMPQNHGMLFDFKIEEPVSMWMKNTYIPLDMIFVAKDGAVVSIAADTEPLSERIIPSGGAIYAVIELNAGAARRIDLAPGDKVRHRIFGR